MTARAWIATWAEIGSLVVDHIGEGLTMLARAIDPPPEHEVVDEGAGQAWLVRGEEWCEDCSCTHRVSRLYTSTDGDLPVYRGQSSDHEEDQ